MPLGIIYLFIGSKYIRIYLNSIILLQKHQPHHQPKKQEQPQSKLQKVLQKKVSLIFLMITENENKTTSL